jgi:hypothetical protein
VRPAAADDTGTEPPKWLDSFLMLIHDTPLVFSNGKRKGRKNGRI